MTPSILIRRILTLIERIFHIYKNVEFFNQEITILRDMIRFANYNIQELDPRVVKIINTGIMPNFSMYDMVIITCELKYRAKRISKKLNN
jgi:hypothetical protein